MTIGKQETNTFFKLQRAIQYNKACYTCTKSSPLWVNVTLSIFVCTDCAGKQRFDPKYKLKSTVLDLWLLEDLKRVKAGGNRLALKHKLDLEDTDDYIQMLDSLASTIENIYETEASVESEIAVEVEEKKMPKLGCVVEKRKVTEKQVREVTKEVEKKPVKTFSIKTNDYDFVDTEWTQSQEIGQKQESKYSYKNMQVQRKVKEKGKLDNVKDALKNATHKGSDLVGYLDVIEEEDTLDNGYRNIGSQNQVEYSNVDDNDTASLVVQPDQKDTHECQETLQIEDEGTDRSYARVLPEDKKLKEQRKNFYAALLSSSTPQTLNEDGDNLNKILESTDIDIGPEYTIPCTDTGSQKQPKPPKPDPPIRSSFLQPFQKFTSSCDIDSGETVEPPIVYQKSYSSVPTKRAISGPQYGSMAITVKANCGNLGDGYMYVKHKSNPDRIQPVTTLIDHKIPGIYKTTDEVTKESAKPIPVYKMPNPETQNFVAKEQNKLMRTNQGSHNKAIWEDTGINLPFRTKPKLNPPMFFLEDDEMILSQPIRMRKERSVKPTRIEMRSDPIVQQLFETQDSGAKNNIEETSKEDYALSKNNSGHLLRKQRPASVEQRHQHQNARSMFTNTQVQDEKPSAQQTKPIAVDKNSKPAELQTLFMEELNDVTKRIADMKNKNSTSGNASIDIVKEQVAVKLRLQKEDTKTYNPISLAAITKSTTAAKPTKAFDVINSSFPKPLYIVKDQNEGVKQNFSDLDHVDISRKRNFNQDLLTSVIQKQSTVPSSSVKKLGNTIERTTSVLPFTSAEKYKTHGDKITNFTLRAAEPNDQMEVNSVGKPVEALKTSKNIQSMYNTPVAAVANRSFGTSIKDKQSHGPKPLPRISSFETSSISTESQKSSRHMFNSRHMKGYSTDKSTGDFDDKNGVVEEQRISERQRCNSSATNKPHTNNIDMTKFDDMLADLNEELDSWAASINYYPGKKKGSAELRKN